MVTYEQTDPLFAIDLSDPMNPVITDEFIDLLIREFVMVTNVRDSFVDFHKWFC